MADPVRALPRRGRQRAVAGCAGAEARAAARGDPRAWPALARRAGTEPGRLARLVPSRRSRVVQPDGALRHLEGGAVDALRDLALRPGAGARPRHRRGGGACDRPRRGRPRAARAQRQLRAAHDRGRHRAGGRNRGGFDGSLRARVARADSHPRRQPRARGARQAHRRAVVRRGRVPEPASGAVRTRCGDPESHAARATRRAAPTSICRTSPGSSPSSCPT